MTKFNKTALSLALSSIMVLASSSVSAATSIIANTGENIAMSEDVDNTSNAGDIVAANGAGAILNTDGHDITTSGNTTSAVNARDGGTVNVIGGKITISGVSANAISSQDGGVVKVSGAEIEVTGENGHGVSADGGTISLDNTNITTTGEKSYGISSETAGASNSETFIKDSVISTEGTQSHGAFVAAGNVEFENSIIKTSGDTARGVSVASSGSVTLNNVEITTTGNNRSDAIVVTSGGEVVGDNVTAHTTGTGSYAAVLGGGNSKLSLSNSELISDTYAALNFTSQTGGKGAEANFENSILKGGTVGIQAGNADGTVNLVSSTVSSDSGVLATGGVGSNLDINASDNTILNGTTTVDAGATLDISLSGNSTWISGGNSVLTNLSLDNSTLIISGDKANPAVGNTVTVEGNYDGNNGKIIFNSVLGDDNSVTDKLVVEGDTSGTTNVQVNNIGGTGSQTVNGIELVSVAGQSDGEFVQDGRIVAGAYEYYLERGDGSNSSNWYLTNTGEGGEPIIRPEGGVYSRNLAAANNMFVSRLQDRLGETHYIDALTGEQKVSSLWVRQEIGKNEAKDSSGQLKTDSDRYIVQLGGDIANWTTNNTNRLHLGLMAGYANQSSETINALSGNKANGSTEGVSVGLYGTWFQDNAEKTGLYLDSWAQYSWFNNKVNGDGLASEKYKSKGFTASLESGYTALIKSSENANYYIQPKAQVVWMGVNADDYVEDNGTVIKTVGDDNIQTRVGIRTYLNKSVENNGKKSTYQPFIEANWIHNSKEYGVQMDDIVLKQDGARNIGEVKLGLEGQANKNTTVWGNVAYQKGSNDYSDAVVKLGVKLAF